MIRDMCSRFLRFGFIFVILCFFGMSGCLSPSSVPFSVQVSHPQEIRATWVQAEAASTREKADAMLARVVKGGFNMIFYCVGSGNVAYHSELLDWGSFVTPDYDPLVYVVEQAHALGIKVQAWWCPGRMMTHLPLREQHPEWDVSTLEGIPDHIRWVNFSLPQVQKFVGDVVAEIAENYAVDGVHLDYIRFPPPPPDGEIDFGDFFSVDDVSNTVATAYNRLQLVDPYVPLTAAVMRVRPVAPAYLQDWTAWLEGQYVDWVVPMAYYGPDEIQRLESVLEDWRDTFQGTSGVVPGLSVTYSSDNDEILTKTPQEVLAQVALCREYGFESFAIFDEQSTSDEILSSLSNLK